MRNLRPICVIALMALLSPGISRAAEHELMRFRPRADFDGDGRTDLSVYVPAAGAWVARSSETAARDSVQRLPRGGRPLTGDFDGDGLVDRAVLQPWRGLTLQRSAAGTTNYPLRLPGALPVSGDLDHDGIDDPGVYHPPSGQWWWWLSSGSTTQFQFGYPGTVPVVGDFDGDGISDPGVYDPGRGLWFMKQSRDGIGARQFGYPGVQPVVGDFNGDGRDDPGIYDPARRGWFLAGPRGGQFSVSFGENGAIPAVGDIDDDARADLLLYQPRTGIWYQRGSRTALAALRLGLPGGVPAVSATLAPARARRLVLTHREAIIGLDNSVQEPIELRGSGNGTVLHTNETVAIIDANMFHRRTFLRSDSGTNSWQFIVYLTTSHNGSIPSSAPVQFMGSSRLQDRLIVLGASNPARVLLNYHVLEINEDSEPFDTTSGGMIYLDGLPVETWDHLEIDGQPGASLYFDRRKTTRGVTPGSSFLVEMTARVDGSAGHYAGILAYRFLNYYLNLDIVR